MFMVRDIWGKRILLKLQDIKMIREYNPQKYVMSAEMSKQESLKCKSVIELVYSDVIYLSTTFNELLELLGMCAGDSQEDSEVLQLDK